MQQYMKEDTTVSKTKKEPENTGKVMTKYDLKMERRRKEREKEERARKRMKIGSIVVLLGIAVLIVGSVGTGIYRKQKVFHGTYVKVGGYGLTQLEYDYYFNSASNNYISNYSYLLSYMGLDPSLDYNDQIYSGEMTWKDFFDQLAVSQIQEVKALKDDAAKNGFTFDEAAEYQTFKEDFAQAAESAGVSKAQYYKNLYGDYATEKNVAPFVKDTLLASAYYEKITEDNAPSQEEIDAYYEENKIDYDTVDYRSFTFESADITEESEEADRTAAVEEFKKSAEEFKERLEAGEDFNTLCIEYAADDETKADYQDEETDYSLEEGVNYSSAYYVYSEWLFDEARTEGEITVVPDEANGRCYVLRFEGRNKDTETVNESISNTLSNQAAGEYVAALTENYEVTDVAGDLKYLVIQAEEEAAQSEEAATEGDTAAEDAQADTQTDTEETDAGQADTQTAEE